MRRKSLCSLLLRAARLAFLGHVADNGFEHVPEDDFEHHEGDETDSGGRIEEPIHEKALRQREREPGDSSLTRERYSRRKASIGSSRAARWAG